MTNEEIQNIFFLECEEALASAEDGLMACRCGQADGETVNGIFRAVHSIKGGAGAFSFTALQAFTHKFETVLSFVRDGELPLSEGLTGTMLRAFDVLSDHVSAVRGLGETPDDATLSAELERIADRAAAGEPVVDEPEGTSVSPANERGVDAHDPLALDFDLDSLLVDLEFKEGGGDVASASARALEWIVEMRPRDAALGNGSEPLLMLRELVGLGGRIVSVDASALPPLEAFDADRALLGWTVRLPATIERSAIEDIFDFVGEDVSLTITQGDRADGTTLQVSLPRFEPVKAPEPTPAVVSAVAPAAPVPVSTGTPAAAPALNAAQPGQTVRVDLNKLDRLIDTVGELVIAQAMMAQKLASSGMNVADEMGMLDHLTREIQESTMAIRAQPIGSVFSRVPRIVRELESDTGKRVQLTMSGEGTELDKTVIERLGEPLTHLIRNAVDHGIEQPETRIAAGKPAEGRLHLSAEQRSGRILIALKDDGAGINREVVLAKAVEKGIVAAGAQLSSEDIDNLIFAPGFSTAKTVSNISGRGVGMDVVRQNVKDLGGRISIESQPGEGCTFTLALPLTLAIADGMIVHVGDQTVVIPLTHVVESLRPGEGEVQQMGTSRAMLNNRGRFLPIVPLDGAVCAQHARNNSGEAVLIIVETQNHGQAALMVDDIVDQRQFVIKSLEAHYQQVRGVAGATILGDGQVALILDVDTLVANSFHVGLNGRVAA